MDQAHAMAVQSRLAESQFGAFRGRDAVRLGVSRNQLTAFIRAELIERVLPDTYRLCAVAPSNAQRLRAALLWAGDLAAADGRSAGEAYALQGVRARKPEIVVPRAVRVRDPRVVVRHTDHQAQLMLRTVDGVRVTSPEATLVALSARLTPEQLEVACEDARRRRLTSMRALRRHLAHNWYPACAGLSTLRALLDELDPQSPSRSTLEVKARRLLVASGMNDFVRELPLEWNGRTYRFDFAFPGDKAILETNGRRWHDDARDYERDNEKWSVPAFHGYRLVLATWEKVTRHPDQLVAELAAACSGRG